MLLAQPLALAAFLDALRLVATGGSVLMFAVKAGTITVLAAAEQAAGAVERPPLSVAALTRASAFSVERFIGGVRRLFRRYLALGALLALAYALATAAYAFLLFGPPAGEGGRGTLVLTLASTWMVGLITLINFLYLLTQIVIAADDCRVGEALSRVGRLLTSQTGPILGILGAILALMVLTTAASVLATAALGLIAFVPFVGLAALPLQVIAWLVRGLVFQYISLAGASAYLRPHCVSRVSVTDRDLSRLERAGVS